MAILNVRTRIIQNAIIRGESNMKNNYIRLLISRWLCTFGTILQSVALPIVVFSLTHSSELLSLTFIFETIPWMFVTPFIISFIIDKISVKRLYISCNILRAIFTFLLAFAIRSSIMTVIIFFVMGTLNSLIASLYSTLIKNTSQDEDVCSILGLSMGIDDVISILAPVLVTFVVSKNITGILFIYCNAVLLFLAALFSLSIQYTPNNSRAIEVKPEKRNIFGDTFHNFQTLLDSKNTFLVVSESLRSLVEGMCIPLLISYVVTIVNAEEELYTIGQVLGATAQVIMSVIYIYLSKKYKPNRIINLGALLMMFAFLMLVFNGKSFLYLVSMIILGAGMAIRQLIGESVFISMYDEDTISRKLSAFNSIIALFYLLGYILSYVFPFIVSLKVIMGMGAILIILPTFLMKSKRGSFVK